MPSDNDWGILPTGTVESICTDCMAVKEIARCTLCQKPICPEHRAGTGRVSDGYQCTERPCWAEHGHRVFAMARLQRILSESPPGDPEPRTTAPVQVVGVLAKRLARAGLRLPLPHEKATESLVLRGPHTGETIMIACVPMDPLPPKGSTHEE